MDENQVVRISRFLMDKEVRGAVVIMLCEVGDKRRISVDWTNLNVWEVIGLIEDAKRLIFDIGYFGYGRHPEVGVR